RKNALPYVHHMLAVRLEFVAPREGLLLEASTRSELPLGFGRQTLACPRRVGIGVVPRNMHHGVLPAFLDIGARSFRMTPGRILDPAPPLALLHPPPDMFRLLRGGKVSEENEAPAKTL